MRHAPPATARPASPRRRAGGFTLIEILIAVAIVALLAGVALPAFQDSIRKSRRAEAFSAIAAVQQAQERWRSNAATYSSSLSDLGIASATTSPGGYYTLTVTADATNPGTTYQVSAAAVSGTSQAKDGPCARLATRVRGGQIEYASCESCDSTGFSFAATNACWSR